MCMYAHVCKGGHEGESPNPLHTVGAQIQRARKLLKNTLYVIYTDHKEGNGTL